MAVIRPFRAVRPTPSAAARVAAVPYDVVDTDEARALAAGNPLSFLHVSRAEIDLPDGIDLHDDIVYRTAAQRYLTLKHEAPLVQESDVSFYLYHLAADGYGQTGVAACYSLAEYDADRIKKHERTRRDKEDDRTRHIVELRAQTGPVFLTYRPNARIEELSKRVRSSSDPLIDFAALGWGAPRDLESSRPLKRQRWPLHSSLSMRFTLPTATIGRPAPPVRGITFRIPGTPIAFSLSRFLPTRSASSRTTAWFAIWV